MAKYTFRIHQVEKVNSSSDGWLESDGLTTKNIANIPDEMENVPTSGKIGTSIPTPLARIYLFKTAYKVLNDAYDKAKDKDKKDGEKGSYAQLVSDSLDILQLLFEKGNDPKLRFIRWNKDTEIRRLKDKGSDPSVLLGESLEMAFNTARSFDSVMTLIEYDGIVLGGLSPFTLVYTSPNLRRELAERRKSGNFDFSSNKKVEYCGVKPISLKDRPKEFQEYLWSLTAINNSMLEAENSFRDFGQYVRSQLGDRFMPITDEFRNEFEYNYKEFNPSLEIAGLKIRWNNRTPDLENSSDFIMAPTTTEYRKYMSVAPLVLPEKFTQQNWKYADDYWDSNTQILVSMCTDRCNGSYKGRQIGERYLPKNGGHNGEYSTIKYPWVSNSDFFYDTIIDLGYAINTDKYFNNASSNADGGAISFLLPIRREFFLFFKVTDLEKYLKINATYKYANKLDTLEKVEITLNIPLKGGKNIALTKTYDSSNIYSESPMGLGVFPFYQLHNDSGLQNEYSVYLFEAETNKKISLKFFADNNLESNIKIDGRTRTESASRSTIYNLRNQTSNKFDFIEVGVDNYSALIVPLWEKYKAEHNNSQANETMISLDFGTSNTHIAYYNPIAKKIESFSIGAKDMQMVLLNQPKRDDTNNKIDYKNAISFGRASDMAHWLREFVPSVIGKESFQGIEYPVKTASLNSPKLYDDPEASLFETVNIGYYINNEVMGLAEDFEYATNLKWAAQNARRKEGGAAQGGVHIKRIDAYCEQTLWMLKNMIVNNGYYSKNIGMVYYYPASMESQDQRMFKDAWKKAIKKIFTDRGFMIDLKEPELESVAPYYSLLHKIQESSADLFAYNSINIDIGGGTTDVFILDKEYRDPDTHTSVTYGYEASVQFAGDNIWGAAQPTFGDNGFVRYMVNLISNGKVNMPEDLKKLFDIINGRDKEVRNLDLAAFFFKYPEYIKFAERISDDSYLKKVLLLHYASIIYYVTDIIKHIKTLHPEFKMPSTLTFTGKGSEYIKIIAPEEKTITNLTYVLFTAFGIKREEFEHGFSVRYTPNPKILTAEGGIHKYMTPNISIKFVEKEEFEIPDPNERKVTAKFEKIGKKILGFKTDGDKYWANQVMNYKDAVMSHFNDFIEAIFNNRNNIQSILKDISIEKEDISTIKSAALKSYDVLGRQYEKEFENQAEPRLESNIFFLAVANMIVEYSNLRKPENR